MARSAICQHGLSAAAAAFILSVQPVASSANEPTATTVQRVQVYPTHYAAGDRRFTELDGLEDWVKSTGARSLEFHTCMWTGTARLAAAIERFQNLYLDVRWIDPGKAGCPGDKDETASRRP